MPIDIHAHYVPRQLIEAVKANGAEIGVRLITDKGETPAIGFDYGFSTRPLFAKLIESAQARRQSLERQGLDRQLLATWPDVYGYGLAPTSCVAWHRMLNDTLAEWSAHHSANGAPTIRTGSPGLRPYLSATRRAPRRSSREPPMWAPWR
jgi:aminocarboxymuconate-semialdehyde decarboxylase